MTSQITLFLQVVLLTAVTVSQHNCLPTDFIEPNDQDMNGFFGENLSWMYDTNGARKFMHYSYGYTTFKSIYTFTQEPTGSNHVSISLTDSTTYIYVDPTAELHFTGTQSRRTIFQIAVVPGSEGKFNLHYNSTEPLVSPSADDPFYFYTKSRYPSEPLAEFYVFPPTLAASYAGKLENILPTLQRIRNENYGDRNLAYRTLLTEMKKFNHHLESELFTVGIFIKEDTGVNSTAYLQLPLQVQLIVSGDPLTLYYRRSPTLQFPMKYDRAQNHTIIFPYIFTYSNTTSGTWSISNIATQSEHQLFVETNNPFYLRDKVSGVKEFVFKFKLVAGEEQFTTFHNSGTIPLVTQQNGTPFHFMRNPTGQTALFFVQKYSEETTFQK